MHWSSLNNESKRSFNKLIFPEGVSYSLEENITTPKMSKVFNVYRENTKHKGIWWTIYPKIGTPIIPYC